MKSIAIIGGGMCGLATLHYLNQRFGKDVNLVLYERNNYCGGNVHTIREDGFLFEYGPNGFLNNQPNTLSFIDELGLTQDLIESNPKAKKRFVQVNGRLCRFPTDLISFLNFKPFSYLDSLRLMSEILIPNKESSDESVYDFIKRRCGQATAEYLIDPFVTGIFAGDIKQLNMSFAFPKIALLEKKYGSLIKAFFSLQKNTKLKTKMLSLKQGMGFLADALAVKYSHQIKYNQNIQSINDIITDQMIVTTPSYVTSRLVSHSYPQLAKHLDEIHYTCVAVVGFSFSPQAFKRNPQGFGYLVPSNQKKSILGVLIESNVFEHRAPVGQYMLRVMIGGRHHPHIINDDAIVLITAALRELDLIYGLKENPINQWVKIWPKAIAQYEMNYPHTYKNIRNELTKTKGLCLAGNYLDGISFNDAIINAKSIAYSISL